MKAILFHGGRWSLEDVPRPEPAPGEALIRVAACGLCHTDLHYLDHGVPTFKTPPLVLGHEATGTVVETGERVLIPAVLTCGACPMCRTGRANICGRMTMLGNHRDGAFAEYVSVPSRDLLPLPNSLKLEEACIIADAVTTAYHAVVRRAAIVPGERVVVFGCGGVGLNVVQVAALAGARVTAVDLDDAKLEVARSLGAAEVGREAGRGFDAAFECIGRPETIRAAQNAVRVGGRIVVVGYTEKPVEISAAKLMFFEQTMLGSLGCNPADFGTVIALAAEGRLKLAPLLTGRFALTEFGAALDALRSGRGIRNVLVMS